MELEEALQRIRDLETEATTLAGTHKDAITALNDTHKTELQVNYNKGFDKAKNASKEDIEKGFVSKDEVEKMLKEQTDESNIKLELSKAGVKNVEKAFKLIDERDGFKIDDFKKDNDFLFPSEKDDDKKDDDKENPEMKNNTEEKSELTAESYSKMSKEEQAKVSTTDKLGLL